MDNPIKAGDIVVLKSGGPKMTVMRADTERVPGGAVRCVWFLPNAPENGPMKFWFAVVALVRLDP